MREGHTNHTAAAYVGTAGSAYARMIDGKFVTSQCGSSMICFENIVLNFVVTLL